MYFDKAPSSLRLYALDARRVDFLDTIVRSELDLKEWLYRTLTGHHIAFEKFDICIGQPDIFHFFCRWSQLFRAWRFSICMFQGTSFHSQRRTVKHGHQHSRQQDKHGKWHLTCFEFDSLIVSVLRLQTNSTSRLQHRLWRIDKSVTH